MTRRITFYVFFVTLIWGAHSQYEEKIRDQFKSNMTRNAFSKLLSSLIKLNEKRVSVLQELYKLQEYGVLSDVLRTGARKPEDGSGKPNNLFLIVMSKNKTNPSRRNLDFEVVDTVTSLNVGNKEIHPKLSYVLDPSSFISRKKKSKESVFGTISKIHSSQKKFKNDGSNSKSIDKKPYRTEIRDDTNHLGTKQPVPKAKLENEESNESNKIEMISIERSANLSLELYDDSIESYPQIEQQTTKTVTIENAKSYNNNYEIQKDLPDNSYSFSTEYVDDIDHLHNTTKNGDISNKKFKFNRTTSELINQGNKYAVKTGMEPTIKFKRTDTLSNIKQNHKEKDDYNVSSFRGRDAEIKYTKIDIDYNSPKPKQNTHSPKMNVQSGHHPKFNEIATIQYIPDNKYTAILEEIDFTTINVATLQDPKTVISPISEKEGNKYSTLKMKIKPTHKTDILDNKNQNAKTPLEVNILEDESYYGSPFSKEYDEKSPRQTTKIDDYNPKIKVQNKQRPDLNESTAILEQNITYPTTNSHLKTTATKSDIKIVSTANKESGHNQSINNSNSNLDSKIKDEHISKEKETMSTKNVSGSQNTETTKGLPLKTYQNYDYSKAVRNDNNTEIANYYSYEIEYYDDEPENNTNPAIQKTPPPVFIVGENVVVKTLPPMKTESTSQLKNVAETANDDKPKVAEQLRSENKKPYIDNHGKVNSGDPEKFVIDQKKGGQFSIIVTSLGKDKSEPNLREILKEIEQPGGKPIARKGFQKCVNKKAKKLCSKSCINAYKNVCTRLKCTSRAKKALKKECKKSCEKTFKSSSSKYSDEDSDDSDSAGSDSSY